MSFSNVSSDLIWEITRNQNSFLVKAKDCAGGVQFSRDPYNLTNQHSRTHAGFVNDKALSIVANEKGGVKVTSKKAGASNKPASGVSTVTFGNTTARKTYKNVARLAAKNHYRPDLRAAAVSRASAIRASQRTPKADPEKKLRGNAAKKAASA
ncbi:ribosomal protein L28e [Cercophora scortea]|uniref:Ribosomal protein L28e n=1 Tax=Cercophora scortea TaxID=314031 RepID=A0AAE0IZI5_9PEZI|nr:ribosomal protein L28e [Cercophora scortea]